MPTQVIMPKLGESVVEGTVGRWLVGEGQPVKEYEPLLAVTTDKVDTEVPAPATGILLKIYVAEGQTVAAGALLAEIGEAGEQPSGGVDASGVHGGAAPAATPGAPAGRPSATPLAQRLAAEHGIDLADVPAAAPGGKVTREDVEAFLAATGSTDEDALQSDALRAYAPRAGAPRSLGFISPAVGRLAAEMGVDLAQVVGTGAGGRITKKDVLAYVATPAPRGEESLGRAPASDELPPWERPGSGDLFKPTEEMGREAPAPVQRSAGGPTRPAGLTLDSELAPMSAIRRSIARHMVDSKQTSPHVTTVMEADLMRVVQARERLKGEFERQGVRLTFTPFFVQAVVAGLKAVPEANSSFTEEGLLVHRRIHVGMAVAIAEGLIVPVIRDADERSLLGLSRVVNDLAERARAKQLAPDEVQGGTFTLTNHGTAGSLFAAPIINQPQAGILGVGAIQKRAVVLSKGHPLLPDAEDAIAIRPMAYLSFAFDHRILDGRSADAFLEAVVSYLEAYSPKAS